MTPENQSTMDVRPEPAFDPAAVDPRKPETIEAVATALHDDAAKVLPKGDGRLAENRKAKAKAPAKWGAGMKTDAGLATLNTFDEQIRFANLLIANKMVSETFKEPASVVLGIQYAKALKMEPIVALKMMYVIDGRPTIFGDAPLGLAWRSKQLASCEEFWIDENGERIRAETKNLKARPFGSVTRLLRVGDPVVQEDFFTKDDLKLAGIDVDTKRGGRKAIWQKYERIMMRYKGRTIALKSKCTDLLSGLSVAEYDFDFTPQVPQVPPRTEQPEQATLTEFLESEGGEA